jgi:hypothetical protein
MKRDKGKEFMDMGSSLEEQTPEWMLAVRAEIEFALSGVGLEIYREFLRAKAVPKFADVGEVQQVAENAWTQTMTAEWELTGEGSFNFNVANKFYLTGSMREGNSYRDAEWTCSTLNKHSLKDEENKAPKKVVARFGDVVRWMLNN